VELVRAGEEGLAGAIAALAGMIRRRRTPPTRAAAEHGLLSSVYFRITTLMHQYRQAASSNHSANVNTPNARKALPRYSGRWKWATRPPSRRETSGVE
jgi:hypothetical protein